MKKHIAMLACLSAIPVSSAHALAISADTNTFLGASYGEKVLNSILENWQKPQDDVSGRTAIVIRLTNDGRPYSCEVRVQSSSPAVDNSICSAVAQIGQFPALESNDSGEVYLSFVHDDKAFLQKQEPADQDIIPAGAPAAPAQTANAGEAITGNEQVDDISNPIENPMKELQENAQVEVNSAPLAEEPLPQASENEQSAETAQERAIPAENSQQNTADTQKANEQANPEKTSAAAPSPESLLATAPQPETLIISKEEALTPPSENLVNPAATLQDYSDQIFKMAVPKIRIPSNVSGKFKVVTRLDLLADGTLKEAIITKSSQNPQVDAEILRVLKNEIQYAPLPTKTDHSFWLTFNVAK